VTDFFSYRAFGLNIASTICLPGLPATVGPADVVIRVGELSADLSGLVAETPFRRVAPDEYVCSSHLFGGYAIYQGREIVVTQQFGAFLEMSHLAALMLEAVFIFVWLQRGALCLHASCVNIGGTAIVLTGDGGSGKSTTSAALVRRGHDKLADDICLIVATEDGKPYVVPLCHYQRLSLAALTLLGMTGDGAALKHDEDKYLLPHVPTTFGLVPVDTIYHLKAQETDDLKFQPVTGIDKIEVLVGNCKNSTETAKMFVRGGNVMTRLALLSRRVSMTGIIRPKRRDCLAALVNNIENSITNRGEFYDKKRMDNTATAYLGSI
jgi:hypothetical protein